MTSHPEAHKQPSFLLKKKFLLIFGVLLVLFTGFMGSVYLVQQQTTINTKATGTDNGWVYRWNCKENEYSASDSACATRIGGRDQVRISYEHTDPQDPLSPSDRGCYKETGGLYYRYTDCVLVEVECGGASCAGTPLPTGGGTIGCGQSCNDSSECQTDYTCTQDRVCWNSGVCGIGEEPPMARIEGRVLNCAGEPVPGVKAKAWGVTSTTNSSGKFRISKKVKNLNDIEFMQTSVIVGADVYKTIPTPIDANDVNRKFYTSRGQYTPEPYESLRLPEYATGENHSCGDINCTYSGKEGDGSTINEDYKLRAEGLFPRTAYIMYDLEDDFFARNFVSQTRYTGSFDFKETNCPVATDVPAAPSATPTPATRACNDTCTSDEQCTAGVGNEGRYCMTNYVSYWWNTLVDDFNQDDGLPAGAKITGINNRLSSNGQKYEQHVIAGNKIYYRERQRGATGWTGIPLRKTLGDNPTDINTYIDDVGCAALGKTTTESCVAFKNEFKIVDFNSYHYTKNGSNYTQQHLIRSNGSKGYVFAVNNEGGWKAESAWTNETASGFGTGTPSQYGLKFTVNSDGSLNGLTSFSAYMDKDRRLDLHAVIGGKVYSRRPGLYNEWRELTKSPSIFATCEASGSCGSNLNNATPIRMFKSINTGDNRYYSYLVRSDGVNVYQRTAAAPVVGGITQEVCRLRWMPHNRSCLPQP